MFFIRVIISSFAPGAAKLPVVRGVEGTLGVMGVEGKEIWFGGSSEVGVGGGISSSMLAPPDDKDPPIGKVKNVGFSNPVNDR